MLQIFLCFVVFFYIVMAFCFFIQWKEIIDRDVYSKVPLILSRLFLLVATIVWPVVVPLAYLELLLKVKNNKTFKGIVLDFTDDE
jgi:uncharacterized membrane protein YidH (DUF202 family)